MMIVTLTPGALKKFCRTPWRFQQTVERPKATDLDEFVSRIIEAHGDLEAATITIAAVIFDTKRLNELCPAGTELTHGVSITAQSAQEAQTLLVAALWDGPDFVCVPTPKPFVIYADHHDMVTFFAHSKSHLNHIIGPLAGRGYKIVQGWQRELRRG